VRKENGKNGKKSRRRNGSDGKIKESIMVREEIVEKEEK
jgi:hypothetical protein